MRRHLAMFAAATALAAGFALAQTEVYDPASIIAAEQAQLRDAKKQSAEAQIRAEKFEAEADAAASAADALKKRIAAIAARIQSAEADISAGEARVALVRRQLRAQQGRLAEQQAPLIRLTATLQQLSRQPPAAVLAQPGSLRDMAHMRALLDTAIPVIEARTASVRRELGRLRTLRAQTATAVETLAASQETLAAERGRLSKLEGEQRLQSRQLLSSARLESDRALGLGEKARDIVALMESLESDGETRGALAGLGGPLLRPADPTRAGGAPAEVEEVAASSSTPAYRLPVVGRIVAGLGEVSKNGVRSRGLTIAARPGAQVVAPADGRVVYAGDYRGYGKIAIIDHGGGWTSLVTGMIGVTKTVGDSVDAGSPLGRAGPGLPQITVELRRNGRPIDIVAMVG
jgi:septal ring factor EnvC (AmiA/AmiB activator)